MEDRRKGTLFSFHIVFTVWNNFTNSIMWHWLTTRYIDYIISCYILLCFAQLLRTTVFYICSFYMLYMAYGVLMGRGLLQDMQINLESWIVNGRYIWIPVKQQMLIDVSDPNVSLTLDINSEVAFMHSSAIKQSPLLSILFFCSNDKVYHKQEVRFHLYLLGQIATDNHKPNPLY